MSSVKTLDKAFEILNFVSSGESPVSLADVADGLALDRSTAHRILASLKSTGMITQTRDKRYKLGFVILRIYRNFLRQNQAIDKAHDELIALADDTGENAHLSFFDGADIVFIDCVESKHAFSVNPRVGEREPAYCTALGKMHLSLLKKPELEKYFSGLEMIKHLPSTITDREELIKEIHFSRQRGYGTDLEEFKEGVRCIAAPINGVQENFSVGISGPAVRLKDEFLEELSKRVMLAGERISRLLL